MYRLRTGAVIRRRQPVTTYAPRFQRLDPTAVVHLQVCAVTRKRPSPPESSRQALGLRADLLVVANGGVLACQYGGHADDQWSVDNVLQLASQHLPGTDHPVRT